MVTAVLLAGLLAAGCSPGSDPSTDVEEALASQADSQARLTERVDGLEQALGEMSPDESVKTSLEQLQGRLQQLEQDLGALRDRADKQDRAREKLGGELRSQVKSLRDRVKALEANVSSLQGKLGEVRTDLSLLREAFDKHRRNHG